VFVCQKFPKFEIKKTKYPISDDFFNFDLDNAPKCPKDNQECVNYPGQGSKNNAFSGAIAFP